MDLYRVGYLILIYRNSATHILALMAILYGPAAGFLIGLIGHGLKDLVFYGMPWFSWVISSAIVGLIIGLVWKKVRVNDGDLRN